MQNFRPEVPNWTKYPKWRDALIKRITELYSDEKTFRELMDLVWAEPLLGSVFEDTNCAVNDKDKLRVDALVDFILNHNKNSRWSGNQEEALKSFLKMTNYIGVVEQKE